MQWKRKVSFTLCLKKSLEIKVFQIIEPFLKVFQDVNRPGLLRLDVLDPTKQKLFSIGWKTVLKILTKV